MPLPVIIPRPLPPLLLLLAAGLVLAPTRAAAQLTAEQRLDDATCGASLVLLGELPSHGELRTFQRKAAMVQRLVERCGVTALVFEAPIYDFLGFQQAVAAGTAQPAQLDNAIGRFWMATELAPWRAWLFEQAAARKLVIGGMDDQVSVTSEYARATLPRLVGTAIGGARAAECEQAVDRHLFWRYTDSLPFDAAEQRRLATCARDAADAWATQVGRDRGVMELAMLQSFASYAERQQEGWTGADRDEAMYRNLRWQLGQLPAGARTVVWTATVHAARAPGDGPAPPLGYRLEEDYGGHPVGLRVSREGAPATLAGRMVSVGFTALAGQSSMAGRPARALPALPPGSLEARALGSDAEVAVLDAPALAQLGAVPSRLLGAPSTRAWNELFDVVVVFRDELAPTFPPRR